MAFAFSVLRLFHINIELFNGVNVLARVASEWDLIWAKCNMSLTSYLFFSI